MPKITKEDLTVELASVLIVMARQIQLWSHRTDLPAQFVGLDEDALEGSQLAAIDLTRFPMAQRVLEMHSYAFAPTDDDSPNLTALHELADMLAGLPREDFSGDLGAFPGINNDSKIQDVCQAAWARAAIDGIDEGLTSTLSTRQIALLAGMTEGAVRNAMTQSGEGGLRAIPKSKPVSFEVDEARRWLAGRRGFHPTPTGSNDDPILNERLRTFERMEQLTDFIERRAARRYGDFAKLVETMQWDMSQVMAWRDGSYRFDADEATVLAEALGADTPTFVGKAIELSLRRDAAKEHVQ